MRPSGRLANQLRKIEFIRHYTKHAEGSVLAVFGDTKVLCTASIIDGVPRFLKGTNQGWLTAEYGMLPRATGTRMEREAKSGRQGGRTLEIQRLIGRALRAALDLKGIGERTIFIDADVLQADGGTRTAAINGACIALVDALAQLPQPKTAVAQPMPWLRHLVAAISVGIYQNIPVLDLDYLEDSNAETDMNVVMTETGGFIEVQGTAEQYSFDRYALQDMMDLAEHGIRQIIQLQRAALGWPETSAQAEK